MSSTQTMIDTKQAHTEWGGILHARDDYQGLIVNPVSTHEVP